MRIFEDDLTLIEKWLSVLSNPNGRVDIDDYSEHGNAAVKRCLDLLISDGSIRRPSESTPNVYVAVHAVESGRMPTIEYYKAVYDAQERSKQKESLSTENIVLQNNEMKYKVKIRKLENVIRLWKVIGAVAGIIGAIGWLLGFLQVL